MIRTLCLTLLLLGLSSVARAADVVIVADGRPPATIFMPLRLEQIQWKQSPPSSPWHAGEAERQKQRLHSSIQDLSATLEKISGAKVPVVAGPPPADYRGVAILVGELSDEAFGAPQKSAPFKQGFRYVVKGNRVGLGGESDLATSYAIYELLDRLGCRWYMPSDMGAVLPKLPTIALPEVDVNSAPGTIYRGIWYADDLYKQRNRMGGLVLSAGHGLEGYITPEQRKEHPEWMAEVGGKPHARRLKWSIPAVADTISEFWLARLDKDPVPSISLSPDDGIDFDESKEDKAIDAGDFDTTSQSVSLTDRLLVICNRIAEQITKKYPDIQFGMLAYGPTTRPPVREKVHPNVVPQIAPITYSRAHPMTDDAVPDNKEFRALVEGWGRAAKSTSVYFYAWFLAEPAAPNPMIKKWSVDVPIVLKNNCQFWQPETVTNFETSMHALYLGNRLAWDPSLKPEAILEELNSRFYGAAAQEMTAYWNYIDDCWTTVPEYSGCGFGYLRRWTPERMAEARRLMDAALAAATTPIETQRIRLADESLDLFETFMKLRHDLANGEFKNLATDADYWRKRIAHLGAKYQAQYAFTRMPYNVNTLSGAYFAQFYQKTYDDAARLAKDLVILTPTPLGQFRFAADADKKGEAAGWAAADFDDSPWRETNVMHDTWSTLGYHAWFKSMWYRTDFNLPVPPPVAKGKKIYLWLGATDGAAKVFINGKHVPYADPKKGTTDAFEGFCQPASFDITEHVKPGANKLAIMTTRTFFNELGTGGLLAPATIYREK